VSFGSELISKISLKKSELTQGGPVYSDILTVYGK
jgi:2'-5' RNA ligase